MSNVRSNLHQARVEHLIASAERSTDAGLHLSADRFLRLATEILDTRRIPTPNRYRAQIDRVQTDAA